MQIAMIQVWGQACVFGRAVEVLGPAVLCVLQGWCSEAGGLCRGVERGSVANVDARLRGVGRERFAVEGKLRSSRSGGRLVTLVVLFWFRAAWRCTVGVVVWWFCGMVLTPSWTRT